MSEPAVVVGGPDADSLEKPVAYVVPKPGAQIDADEVIASAGRDWRRSSARGGSSR